MNHINKLNHFPEDYTSGFQPSPTVNNPKKKKKKKKEYDNEGTPAVVGDGGQLQDPLEAGFGVDELVDESISFKTFRKAITELCTVHESATKAALEDWMYDIPAGAIAELRKIKVDKNHRADITKILIKFKVKPLMGESGVDVIIDYWETFFGE